jgi:hypothetical protein
MKIVFAFLLLAACGGTENNNNADMAMAQMSSDMSGKPFGATCTMSSECATGYCFVGGMMSFCTMACTPVNANSTDCPNPPTSGFCNMKGYCKP